MLLITLCHLFSVASAVGVSVTFANTTFTGVDQGNGVSAWLGLPYAVAPTGTNRFRAPVDWPGNQGNVSATAAKSICLATGSSYTAGGTNPSEDCLYIGVWAPTSATVNSKLPVYTFFQGGGFNSNAHPNINATSLIQASGGNMIMVTFNYRVGLWGFLASSQVKANGNLNNGLLDQRKALQWIQKYISNFGGDPGHVTIGGASAGGASVYYHLTAYGGRDDGLFHAAAGESPSYGFQCNVSESQYQYDQLVSRVGCSTSSDSLTCLRGISTSAMQSASSAVPYSGRNGKPLYMWQPVVDYDFITDYTYRAFAEGNYVKVPTIFGADNDDGTDFAPTTLASAGAMNSFLQDNWPRLTSTMLSNIDTTYPQGTVYGSNGAYWPPASQVYGEMRYRCPSLYMPDMISRQGVPAWNYHWNAPCPDCLTNGKGVTHTIETNAIFGYGGPSNYYPTAPQVVAAQGYWTSFIRSKDPNTYRAAGTAQWDQWQPWRPQSMMINLTSTAMEDREANLTSRCYYLSTIGFAIGQ